MAYETTNPYTAQRIKQFANHTDAELESAVSQAEACFQAWRKKPFTDRAAVLKNAAKILRSHSEKFAKLITMEMGKLIAESRGEVALSADIIDYYALHGEEFLAPQIIASHSGAATIESAPIGVLFGIEPWNFPNYQFGFVAPNLMGGNGGACQQK